MKFKFNVLGSGESSFVSSKNGRQYNRLRVMGMVEDSLDGAQYPAVADLAFDVPPPPRPKSGDVVLLDCVEMNSKSAMLSFTFKSLEPFVAPPARESKRA